MKYFIIVFAIAAFIFTSCTESAELKPQVEQLVSGVDATDEEPVTEPPVIAPENEQTFPDLMPLNGEIIEQIKNDYWELRLSENPSLAEPKDPRDAWIRPYLVGYYGTYNGCTAVMVEYGGYLDAFMKKIIGDIEFVYSSSNTIKIWKEGLFYELQEAFDLGLIVKDDLESINYYFIKYRYGYHGLPKELQE